MKAGYAFFFLIALASIGLFFTKGDLTGNVVFGENVKPLCSSSSECQKAEACCFFYGESQGVCNSQSKCQEVYDVTKQQSSAKAHFIAASRKPIDEKGKPGFELIFGLAALVLVSFLVLRWSDSKEDKKHKLV